MSRSVRILFSLMLGLLALFGFLTTSQPAHADGPDFSNVTDLLAGRRRLFPVDDLVMTLSPNNQPVKATVVQTENGNLGAQNEYQVTSGHEAFATGVGRMFDLPRDVVVTISAGQILISDQDPNGPSYHPFPLNVNAAPNQNQFAMADMTGDGYADFAYIVGNAIYVVTAQDVTNLNAGVFYSQAGAPPFDIVNQWAVLAAGDFDGNGTAEVALAAAQGNAITVTIYTVQVTTNQGALESITLTPAGATTFDAPENVNALALVAGIYNNAVNATTGYPLHSLVVMYQFNQGKHKIDLSSIAVTTANGAPPFTLNVAHTVNWQDSDHENYIIDLASDRLDFWGATEQLVASVSEPGNFSHLAVFTLDNDLNLYKASEKIVTELLSVLVSIAVGNFDQDVSANSPINLEIGVLKYEVDIFGVKAQPTLFLYSVDPANNFALNEYAHANVGPSFAGPDFNLNVSVRAGDTQGRSLLLGPPTKITAQHIQPAIVLGMPPMHVDWVTPSGGNQPELLNLSAVPLGFYSSYQTAVTNQSQSSHQGTTSFSTSLTESVSQKISLGVPDVASVSISTKTSATEAWSNSVSRTYSNYTTTSFDASTQTGFDDQLWYNSERQNIYIYPVIGQYGCPQGNPNCSPSEKVPLNVMFSGPDQIMQTSIGGSTVEWFQPVHEPGNLFSYPWNLTQLQQLEPQLNLLTSYNPTQFYTDSSTRTQQAQWQAGGSKNVTTGSTQNYSWSKSVSVSGDVSIPEAGGLGGGSKFSFSYNGSKSFSTMNSSTTSLGASTGIGVNKPGTFPNPGEYQYAIQPFIYGTNPVEGTIQNVQLNTDIQTNGILRAEFTADPTDPNAGAWWQITYNQPDVALNHPSRWSVQAVTSGTSGANCLPISPGTTTVNCATLNAPNSDIWLSEFHWMKGLLITPADANGEGPQINEATAGDSVMLELRVYNYSLADMPAGSSVVVQFYGQPWDPTTLQPAGNAFLIDQVVLAPIPGFNSNSTGGTQPNWTTASTTALDTAAYSDQYLAFWAMVWMQDAQGNLIQEMPAHGLTGIPGTLDSIAAATPLLEPYSNNIGLYKSLFYIAPAASTLAATGTGKFSIDSVSVSPKRVRLNQEVQVRATLRAGGDHVRGISAVLYDRVGEGKRRAFEQELVSHIRANETHQVRVPFHPTECGTHTITLVTQPRGETARTTLEVTINVQSAVRKLIRLTRKLDLPGRQGGGLMELLKTAQKAFKQKNKAAALQALQEFKQKVEGRRGKGIAPEQADIMLARAGEIQTCA